MEPDLINLVISAATLLAVLVVGFIQQKQLKFQGSQIESMTAYVNLLDVKKLAELREYIDKSKDEAHKLKLLDLFRSMTEIAYSNTEDYVECLTVLTSFVSQMPKESRIEWLDTRLPLSKDKILEALDKFNL